MEPTKLKIVFNPATTYNEFGLKEVRDNFMHSLNPDSRRDWGHAYNVMWSGAQLNEDGNVEVLGNGFVTCKDYLMDAAVNDRAGAMGYINKHPKGYMDTTPSFLLLFLNKKAKQGFLANIALLHEYEKRLRYKRTQLFEVDLHDDLLFVKGSTMWAYNSVLMSMWLSCLRMCTLLTKETPKTFKELLEQHIGKDVYKINELRWGEMFTDNIDLVLTNARKFNAVDLRGSKLWGKNGFGRKYPDVLHGAWGIYNTIQWCRQQAAYKRPYTIIKHDEPWASRRTPVITEVRARFVEIMDKIIGTKCISSITKGVML